MLHLTTRKCIPSPLRTGTLSESGELELDELLLVALAGDVLVGWDDCLSEEDDLEDDVEDDLDLGELEQVVEDNDLFLVLDGDTELRLLDEERDRDLFLMLDGDIELRLLEDERDLFPVVVGDIDLGLIAWVVGDLVLEVLDCWAIGDLVLCWAIGDLVLGIHDEDEDDLGLYVGLGDHLLHPALE